MPTKQLEMQCSWISDNLSVLKFNVMFLLAEYSNHIRSCQFRDFLAGRQKSQGTVSCSSHDHSVDFLGHSLEWSFIQVGCIAAFICKLVYVAFCLCYHNAVLSFIVVIKQNGYALPQ